MFKRLSQKRAQSTLEYAVLIGTIVSGLIMMQVYLKQRFQGKLKESADSMGEQFSPGLTTSRYTTQTLTKSTETLGNEVTTTQIQAQTSNRVGSEQHPAYSQETWWK